MYKSIFTHLVYYITNVAVISFYLTKKCWNNTKYASMFVSVYYFMIILVSSIKKKKAG